MPFCPKCRVEYVADTWKCADCDVPLVPELPPENNDTDGEPMADVKFISLRTYPSKMYAEMVVNALANEGITAILKSNEPFGSGTGLGVLSPPRIEVWVPEDRAEDAAEIADTTIDPA